jgi:hypothetical protein
MNSKAGMQSLYNLPIGGFKRLIVFQENPKVNSKEEI